MGTRYHTFIVYGLKETAEMAKARERTVSLDIHVCTGSPEEHKQSNWKPQNFCSVCGSAIEVRSTSFLRAARPCDVYSAPGTENMSGDVRYDFMAEEYVHQAAPNDDCGDIVLGVALTEWVDVNVGSGAYGIPEPTPEQVGKVDALLLHNGLNPSIGDVRVYVIVGRM